MAKPTAAILDSLDNVDEEYKSAFDETDDGKFMLDPVRYSEIDKKGLVDKNKKLLAFKVKMKGIKEEDIPSYNEWKAKQQADPDGDDLDDDDVDDSRQTGDKGKTAEERRLQKIKAKYEKDIADRDLVLKQKEEAYAAHLFDEFLTKVGLAGEVFPDRLASWKKDAREHFKANEKGKFVFLDEDGEEDPTTTIDKAVGEILRAKYPWYYKAGTEGGSGAGGGEEKRDQVKSDKSKKKKDFTKTEKHAFIGKHGYSEWEKLEEGIH